MTETLDAVLADSLACLSLGAGDPGSVWRNPTLLTIGADGSPQARTIVLRAFDPAQRRLDIHTDARSAKRAELLARPECGLHAWEKHAATQLRLTGRASLHAGDDVADAAWAGLRPQTRRTYHARPGPGTPLAAPDLTQEQDESAARAVFCVIRLVFDRLDWLLLKQGSHRRAVFTWAQGTRQAMWLVP